MRKGLNMISRSRAGVCLLAISLGAPSLAFADANETNIPAQLNRLNETQKACSGEAATQALDQLRASVVQAANSGKISQDVSQSALGAIDQARSALNSDSLKAVSGALLAVGQQVKTVEAQVSNPGGTVGDRMAGAAQRVEDKVAEAAQTVKDKVAGATQQAENQAGDAASNAGQRITRAFSELKPGDVEGKTLYDKSGNEVASVRSVRTAADGRIEGVEIDTGGFFGLGKKQIFIPVNGLQFRDGHIEASSLTADQIRDLPQTASNEGQTLGQEASETARSAGAKVADAAKRVENKVADAAKTVENRVTGATQNAGERASEAHRQVANAAQGPAKAISDLKEQDVLGSTLYDKAGNPVANVLHVQSAPDGRVEAVILDIGGFLGLGSKRIVIPVNQLQVREGRIDAPSLTLEEIHNLPEAAQ